MNYKFTLYEEKDQIGLLTLNRPEKRNALGREMEEEITECLRAASRRQSVKAIIVRAAGEVFCSGHDRKEILDTGVSDIRRLFQASMNLMLGIRQASMPVIAQVQGVAMAGGCHLVAACDLVVAAERNSKFGMTGIYLGYNCSTPTVAVSRCVGQKKCMEMLMTGKLYSSQEAREMGLVNRVVPDEKLADETWALAKEISQYSRKTLAISKQVYYAQIEMTEWQAYHYAKEMMAVNALMPDAISGFRANMAGEKPVFPEDVPLE
ncbi:MAG: enoyl-CoA hydratase-related protein [bacterium]